MRRVDLTGPDGFEISAEAADLPAVRDALAAAGAEPCAAVAFEAARIEWGFPLFGRDISEKNLPQEVARDARAISFVKGCYLGQETVARIDALGHVNRTLVGVRFSSNGAPTPGMELTSDGATAGTVTSASYSPQLRAPMALAVVRRGKNTPGTRLQSAAGDSEVVALPVRVAAARCRRDAEIPAEVGQPCVHAGHDIHVRWHAPHDVKASPFQRDTQDVETAAHLFQKRFLLSIRQFMSHQFHGSGTAATVERYQAAAFRLVDLPIDERSPQQTGPSELIHRIGAKIKTSAIVSTEAEDYGLVVIWQLQRGALHQRRGLGQQVLTILLTTRHANVIRRSPLLHDGVAK